MKEKIKKRCEDGYSSSPHVFNDKELDLIIKHKCQCDYCGDSIFELDDFPEVDVEKDMVSCEDCYDEHFKTTCPSCENSYTDDELTDYFFITKDTAETVNRPVGLYKILKRPYFYGDCVTGFDDFFPDAIEKVLDIDLNKKGVLLDCICQDCLSRYLKTEDNE